MFIELTHMADDSSAWVSHEHVQAVFSHVRGGSRIKMLDGWVDVTEEPDEVVFRINSAVAG